MQVGKHNNFFITPAFIFHLKILDNFWNFYFRSAIWSVWNNCDMIQRQTQIENWRLFASGTVCFSFGLNFPMRFDGAILAANATIFIQFLNMSLHVLISKKEEYYTHFFLYGELVFVVELLVGKQIFVINFFLALYVCMILKKCKNINNNRNS